MEEVQKQCPACGVTAENTKGYFAGWESAQKDFEKFVLNTDAEIASDPRFGDDVRRGCSLIVSKLLTHLRRLK